MKNPNGYGSVIYLGKNRRNPYAVRVTAGWNDGKQQYRYISYHKTKLEAAKALAKEQVTPTSPKTGITFGQLFEEWKAGTYKHIGKQTQGNYDAAYNHLKSLENHKFVDLRTGNFQKIIDECDRSRSTKEKIKLMLNQLYKYALQNDIVMKNYAEFIRLEKEDKKEKEIFNDLEIGALRKNDTMPFVDTILILIYTGLRINEMLTLTKHAIDWKNETITGGLKTDAGKDRVIPIHPKIRDYLMNWYNKSHDILFFKNNNEPITQNYYRKYILPAVRRIGN